MFVECLSTEFLGIHIHEIAVQVALRYGVFFHIESTHTLLNSPDVVKTSFFWGFDLL